MHLKENWIADPIHETIPTTSWEKEILTTQEFNRLHGVLQTSTAYLTYPGARHSRFAHSLGCMHIAGRMFREGLANSSDELRRSFLTDVLDHMERIERKEDKRCVRDVKSVGAVFGPDEIFPYVTYRPDKAWADHHLRHVAPLAVDDRSHRNAYRIAYQSVRLAALLHDVGHAPFSHVAERALIGVHDRIRDLETPNNRQIAFRDILHLGTADFDPELHVIVGQEAAGDILESLVDNLREAFESATPDATPDREVAQRKLEAILLWMLTTDILERNNEIGRALFRIISSYADADRLDFVQRDQATLGRAIGNSGVDRLVRSFVLVDCSDRRWRPPGLNAPKRYLFAPSTRALRTLETVLRSRHAFYRDVVNHHRVRKTDGLLEYILRDAVNLYLEGHDTEYRSLGELVTLWEAMDLQHETVPAAAAEQYAQWDDAWMVSTLRKIYFDVRKREPVNDDAARLTSFLKEFLTNDREFSSLYKRFDHFWRIDQIVFKNLLENDTKLLHANVGAFRSEDNGQYQPLVKDNLADIRLSVLRCVEESLDGDQKGQFSDAVSREDESSYHELALSVQSEAWRAYIAKYGYLTSLLIDHAGLGGAKEGKFAFVEKAVEDLKDSLGYRHAFYVPSKIKVGVNNHDLIAHDGNPALMESYSHITEELETAGRLLPPFFVFICAEHPFNNLVEVREALGTRLWRFFERLFLN